MQHTMPERWLPVVGYEGLYEVSDHGRVRSVARVVTNKRGIRRPFPALMRKPTENHGYKTLRLHKQNRGTNCSVHSLVMQAFEGPCPPGMEVRHIDGNKANNHIGNLAYGSRSENMRDRLVHGTDHNSRKNYCPQGHPYTGANLGIHERRRGPREGERHRYCIACTRARAHIRLHGGDYKTMGDHYYSALR